jgi:hypothetical protein
MVLGSAYKRRHNPLQYYTIIIQLLYNYYTIIIQLLYNYYTIIIQLLYNYNGIKIRVFIRVRQSQR